jgi:hypothetical protein
MLLEREKHGNGFLEIAWRKAGLPPMELAPLSKNPSNN